MNEQMKERKKARKKEEEKRKEARMEGRKKESGVNWKNLGAKDWVDNPKPQNLP